MKTIGETLTIKGFEKEEVINAFQSHLRRNLTYKSNRFMIGSLDNEPYPLSGDRGHRLSMRLRSDDHELISELAYTMDVSVQGAAASIITEVLSQEKLMYDIRAQLIKSNLDETAERQIRRLASQINMKSPYEYITLNMVLGYALEKANEEQKKVRLILSRWVNTL